MSVKDRQLYGDRERLQDYRAVFNSAQGQRVLNDMMARHYVFGGTFHTDQTVMIHREGERNVILEIMRYLELKPKDTGEVRQSIREQFGLEELTED